ncbi:MAG: sel1 repeat family protein [Acidobacteriia bacterium]|nr:sel1 repeat family protein [Terriglobia bacterium]
MRFGLALSLVLYVVLAPVVIAQNASLGLNAPQLYEKGMNNLMGVGISRNDLNAIDYLRRSAELGYLPAQVVLGYFYETGSVVSRDFGQASDWYKKAAKQDDRLADWLVGRLYYTGNGIPRDLSAAESWLQRAASQGDPFGQYLLGQVRLERNDYPKAAEWFRKAAMQGLPQAQAQLGELFKQGQGVTVDKFEAYIWLLVSFDAGNQTIAADLAALEGELGSNRVDEAKSKARDLEQTVSRAVVSRGCDWAGAFDPVPTPPPPDIQRFCR